MYAKEEALKVFRESYTYIDIREDLSPEKRRYIKRHLISEDIEDFLSQELDKAYAQGQRDGLGEMKKDLPSNVTATIFTGNLYCDPSEFHEAMEYLLGRSVWTHEFADKSVWEQARTQLIELYTREMIVNELESLEEGEHHDK